MATKTVSFEVFGRVQGVFFRKYTKKTAAQLQLVGWVMNTKVETVVGCFQGKNDGIDKMKHWLKHEGSPKSRIDKCVFSEEKNIETTQFKDFLVRR